MIPFKDLLTISHTGIFGNSHWQHGNYRVWNILQQKFTYCNKQTMQHCQKLCNTLTLTSSWRLCFCKSSNPAWYSQEAYSNTTFCGTCFIHYAKTMIWVKMTVKKRDSSLYQLVFPILTWLFWACLQTTVWRPRNCHWQ